MPPNERLSAVLDGRAPLVDDLRDVASELGEIVDEALAAAGALESAEESADDFADELADVSREAQQVAASTTAATAGVEGLDAALSDLDGDVDFDFADVDLDALSLDADDLATAVSTIPDEAVLARSALERIAETDLDFEADVDLDTADLTRRVALSVDRSGLQEALSSLPDREIDVNPVLRSLRGSLGDIDAGEATARAAVTTDASNIEAPYSAAVAAVASLTEEVDDLETSLVAVDRAAHDLPGRVRVDVSGDVDDILADLELTEARLSALDVDARRLTDRLDFGETVDKALIDITLGESEREVLSALAEIRGSLATLPDREDVAIHTDADLDGLIATMVGIESLPAEVRSEVEVDALTGEAQAALTAVLAQAEALDALDPTVNVDADTTALSVLRRGGDGFDLDLPDFERRGRDDSFGAGIGAVGASLSRLTRTSGAISALRGLGPAGIAGATGAGGTLVSTIAGAVSAGIGAGIGAAAIGGGLALPVALNIDEGEIDALKRNVESALAPLEGGEWEALQQRIFSGIPQAAGMTAGAINSVRSELLDTADEVGDSFWVEFPKILDETTESVRALDDDISSISIGVLETIPGLIRESTRAGDELLPEFTDLAVPTGDILGSGSRLGTGALDFGINAFLEPALDTLAALAPLADLLGDALHVAGEAAAFVYENIGQENIAATAGAIQTVVDLAYAFGELVYNIGVATGAWDALATVIRAVGDGFGYVYRIAGDAYEAIAGGAEWVLEKIISLHNRLNDVPGAAEMSRFIAEEDIAMPDFSGGPGGGGGDGGGSPDFGGGSGEGTGAPTATITGDALASLPSTSPTASSSAGTASTSGTGTAGTTASPVAGMGGTTYNQTFNNDVTVNADGTSVTEMRRVARTVHNQLMQRQQQTTGPGN